MAKILLFVLVALLSVSLITAAATKTSTKVANQENCGRHGDPCVSQSECCAQMRCHAYAHRCQVIITEEELMAQREKILGRKGKDY